MSLRFRVVFALACAALAVMLCLSYADTVRAEAQQQRDEALARYGGELTSLVVARKALEPGDVVESSDIYEREWVAELAPQGACTSVDDVLGKEITVPVAENTPLSELSFRERTELGEIPEGHVALCVAITDKLGISRAVAVGTKLMCYVVDAQGSELIAQDVSVLAAPGEQAPQTSGAQLTLSIPFDRVSAVLSASAAGTLRIVIPADNPQPVNPADNSLAVPVGDNSSEALTGENPPETQANNNAQQVSPGTHPQESNVVINRQRVNPVEGDVQ